MKMHISSATIVPHRYALFAVSPLASDAIARPFRDPGDVPGGPARVVKLSPVDVLP